MYMQTKYYSNAKNQFCFNHKDHTSFKIKAAQNVKFPHCFDWLLFKPRPQLFKTYKLVAFNVIMAGFCMSVSVSFYYSFFPVNMNQAFSLPNNVNMQCLKTFFICVLSTLQMCYYIYNVLYIRLFFRLVYTSNLHEFCNSCLKFVQKTIMLCSSKITRDPWATSLACETTSINKHICTKL